MAGHAPQQQDDTMGGTEEQMGIQSPGAYNADYHHSPRRPSVPSDSYQPANGSFSPGMDSDPNTRYPSNNSQYQQPQPYSRPSSGLSGGYGHTAYQDQNQRSSHTDQRAQNNSVVIKVGMVGDAQIGKTSLMVKYVEGQWDEDYIQTLGENINSTNPHNQTLIRDIRRQLHGEDDFNPQHRDHLLNLGFRRPTRICQHAASRLQRRRRNPLHVRSHAKKHAQFHQRVV